jgi:hypothetical protein
MDGGQKAMIQASRANSTFKPQERIQHSSLKSEFNIAANPLLSREG